MRPRYIASTGERVYVEGPVDRPIQPDVWLRRAGQEGGGLAVADATVTDEPALIDVPGTEVHEPYIEILDRESGMRVVTVIELVSPSNKYAGTGRDAYVTKQQEVRSSTTHLVEIDLLRYGPHVLAERKRAGSIGLRDRIRIIQELQRHLGFNGRRLSLF